VAIWSPIDTTFISRRSHDVFHKNTNNIMGSRRIGCLPLDPSDAQNQSSRLWRWQMAAISTQWRMEDAYSMIVEGCRCRNKPCWCILRRPRNPGNRCLLPVSGETRGRIRRYVSNEYEYEYDHVRLAIDVQDRIEALSPRGGWATLEAHFVTHPMLGMPPDFDMKRF
jgi:hypothetical protein